VEFEEEVSEGVVALLDEVLVGLPTSARLIDPVDFDCGSLVEGVVVADLPVDALVRGGALEEADGDGFDEFEEDVEGIEGDVDRYWPEEGPDGFEPDVDGFELEVEGLLEFDGFVGDVEGLVDDGSLVEGELLDGELVDGLVCVDELLCCEELVAPLEAPVDVEPGEPLDVCA
jgi:hypothetical protein